MAGSRGALGSGAGTVLPAGLDPVCFPDDTQCRQTAYEYAWEIWNLLGYRDFADGEAEVRRYVAALVWSTTEGPRVSLPGITVLTRLVGEVRKEENARLHRSWPSVPTLNRIRRWPGYCGSPRTGGSRNWSGCVLRRRGPRAGR